MKRRSLPFAAIAAAVSVAALAGCSTPSPIPDAETPFAREKLVQTARFVPIAAVREFPVAPPEALGDAPRDPRADWVDLASPGIADLVARLSDPAQDETAIATTPLGVELIALVVWARHPGVAAARAELEAARRVFQQASWLDDVATRYRSISSPWLNAGGMGAIPAAPVEGPMAARSGPAAAAPAAEPAGDSGMDGAAMDPSAAPAPTMPTSPGAMGASEPMRDGPRVDLGGVGLAALRAEMLDREVEMARERLRMVYRDALVEALRAYHDTAHHEEELRIRRDQVSVLDRMVAAARARVETGQGPQAELLEVESELAMARNDLAHAEKSLESRSRALNSLLRRDVDATFRLAPHADPPETVPDAVQLGAVAARWSPEVRMARAESARLAAAARMAVRDATMDPTRVVPESTAPFAAEVAERRRAAARAVTEAERAAERRVLAAQYELGNMSRMFRLSATTTEPLAQQALEERMRLYEAGRGEFAELLEASRRHLAAEHDVALARHEYGVMEAMLWMAVGARPDLVPAGAKESGR